MWEHPDFLQLVAASNDGPERLSIGCPATFKNGVTVGASENVPIAFRQSGGGLSISEPA